MLRQAMLRQATLRERASRKLNLEWLCAHRIRVRGA